MLYIKGIFQPNQLYTRPILSYFVWKGQSKSNEHPFQLIEICLSSNIVNSLKLPIYFSFSFPLFPHRLTDFAILASFRWIGNFGAFFLFIALLRFRNSYCWNENIFFFFHLVLRESIIMFGVYFWWREREIKKKQFKSHWYFNLFRIFNNHEMPFTKKAYNLIFFFW